MLTTLRIKDYALVEQLEVNFPDGLSVLSGLTGAGKSIIAGAINLLLGGKTTPEDIRSGCSQAVIEGIFQLFKNSPGSLFLKSCQLQEQDDAVIIRREITPKSSRCLLNDKIVSQNTLKQLGDFLVDIHSQHSHQSLLNPETHLEFLDNFGGTEKLASEVKRIYLDLINKQKQISELEQFQKESARSKELYEFQVNEIRKANLQEGEEEKLQAEKRILENLEALREIVNKSSQILYEDEDSVFSRLKYVQKEIEKGAGFDSVFKEQASKINELQALLEDTIQFLEHYKNKLEFDPQRLEEIRERLSLIAQLKKKYGSSLAEILKFQQELIEKLSRMSDNSDSIKQLQNDISRLNSVLKEKCLSLSNERKKQAQVLETKIKKELSFLGLKEALFEIHINWQEDQEGLLEIDRKRYSVNEDGLDKVEFYISFNIGEEAKPLVRIASGGEVSRVMLALKSALAEADFIPTLIFDEIDAGIGGEVAENVGRKLKKLANLHQIVCITHLQQIASFAGSHFLVYKESKSNRTVIKIKKLSEAERVSEIARMISGKKITQSAYLQASELLEGAQSL